MVFIIIIGMILGVDLCVKSYIERNRNMNQEEDILGGKITITRYHNKGAMLNLLEKNASIVLVVSGAMLGILFIIFAFFLPKKGNTLLKLGLSMVLGGAASNVYDRVKRGYVVDYFSFHFLKKVVFNIGDLFVIGGSVLILVWNLFKGDKN